MTKSCSLIFALLVVCTFAAANDATLEDVLELNTAAMGGKDAIEEVRAIEIHLTIQEPEFTVEAIYVADRKIRMRIDVYSDGKRVYTEAFDGKNAWQMGEDGKAMEPKAEGAAALRNGIFLGKFFGLYELSSLGHKLAYEGRQTVENVSYHVLKLTLDSGKEVFLYIHPETGFVEKTRDVKALHPDLDTTKKSMESTNSDFRKIGGTFRSFKSVQKDLKTGQTVQTTIVKEVKINPKLDDSLFVKP